MSNDQDRWTLRAELEARKEEVATLRGVVAALRGVVAMRRDESAKRNPRRVTTGIMIAAFAVGALVGFASALAVTRWH